MDLSSFVPVADRMLANGGIAHSDMFCQHHSFIISGSFASALKLRELHGLSLAYNDIDLYVQMSDECVNDSDDIPSDALIETYPDQNIYKQWHEDWPVWFHGRECQVDVNIVVLKRLDCKLLVETFDINIIRVGVTVHRLCRGFYHLDWYDSDAAFVAFCQDRTRMLRTARLTNTFSPAMTLVRLMFKAQQLKLPFEFPKDDELYREGFFGRRWNSDVFIAGSGITKFAGLEPSYRNILESRLEFAEIAVVHGRPVRLVRAQLTRFDAWVKTLGDTS